MDKAMSKEAAVAFFAALFLGEHHIPSELKPFGLGWCVSYRGSLATFDFDALTRLVFLAHDRCVRAEVHSGGPARVRIAIWQRQGRDGRIFARHPTIDAALEIWRRYHPAPADASGGAEQLEPREGLRIVFDGPPGKVAGRFVEVEDESGRSVCAGEWRERPGGLWELVLDPSLIEQ